MYTSIAGALNNLRLVVSAVAAHMVVGGGLFLWVSVPPCMVEVHSNENRKGVVANTDVCHVGAVQCTAQMLASIASYMVAAKE